jgi:16S rRNA (cytosine1402-N4)-methyltransferase
MPKTKTNNDLHQPVLINEVLHYLDPQAGESYLDLTAGYGGHAATVLARTKASAVLVDRDQQAIDALKMRFDVPKVEIIHKDFAGASAEMLSQGRQFDLILADLGVSSPHLEDSHRGFSFKGSAPLDMRMDSAQELSAQSIVNSWSEQSLTELLAKYGEEPKARTIARAIVAARPLSSTDQLAAIAARAWPGHSKVHPATRTFQALRIAVNDELGQLEQALPLWLDLLNPGGRLAVISFHSLEDRAVKQFLADNSGDTYTAQLQLLTKKPVTAQPDETVSNPRARSAKLRAAAKIKNKKGYKGI